MLPWMATGAVPVRIRTATHFSSENSHRETLHRGRMFRSPRAFVGSTATLRYEPCTQFINVSQRNLTFPQTSDFLLIYRFLRYSALSIYSECSYVPFSGSLPQNCYYQKHHCETKFNHCREPDSSLQNTYSRMF